MLKIQNFNDLILQMQRNNKLLSTTVSSFHSKTWSLSAPQDNSSQVSSRNWPFQDES